MDWWYRFLNEAIFILAMIWCVAAWITLSALIVLTVRDMLKLNEKNDC